MAVSRGEGRLAPAPATVSRDVRLPPRSGRGLAAVGALAELALLPILDAGSEVLLERPDKLTLGRSVLPRDDLVLQRALLDRVGIERDVVLEVIRQLVHRDRSRVIEVAL